MSTIASPRDTSVSGRKPPTISTPTGSSRPSIDSPRYPRSQDTSPSRTPQPRRNRAALREYYNIKKEEQKADDDSSEYSINDHSEVQESEMDRDGFKGEVYVKHALETQSLEELLKTYNQVLSDIRALDAEKKSLVYDNYSKLIAATETIRRMRVNMDPLNPMASTLDPAIAQIYERANAIKAELRESIAPKQRAEADMSEEERTKAATRIHSRDIARKILDMPEKLRQLMAEDKEEEAIMAWEGPLRTLETWKASGQGGPEVQDCIDDGESALRGEPPSEKSWVNIKSRKS